jgi:hypothetical protein
MAGYIQIPGTLLLTLIGSACDIRIGFDMRCV